MKNAVDSRIAEEQARQKAAGTPVSRSASSARRSTSRTDSPSSKLRKPRPKDNDGIAARGPDPSEFENAFVIEDEPEEPSRVGTPDIMDEKAALMADSNAPTEANAAMDGGEKVSEKAPDTAPRPSTELPADVRTKLRKLEKLESRYQGMIILPLGLSHTSLTQIPQSSYVLIALHMAAQYQ